MGKRFMVCFWSRLMGRVKLTLLSVFVIKIAVEVDVVQ